METDRSDHPEGRQDPQKADPTDPKFLFDNLLRDELLVQKSEHLSRTEKADVTKQGRFHKNSCQNRKARFNEF